jgi:hypothetical protein
MNNSSSGNRHRIDPTTAQELARESGGGKGKGKDFDM